MAEKKVRWGILGAAKIAREKLIPAIGTSQTGEVVAVASRTQAKADALVESLTPEFLSPDVYAHGSYEALLADHDVDAIYNPLPNDLHVGWSIAALQAGKHVLCEKPLGLNAADVQRLIDVAEAHPKLKAMEAFMYRFHPQWLCVQELIQTGRIGEVRAIQARFTYNNHDPNNIRNNPAAGGGALMDIGCYTASLARLVMNAEPERAIGLFDLDERFQVDNIVNAILSFHGGATASFTCTTKTESGQGVYIAGTKGSLTLDTPFYNQLGKPTVVSLRVDGQEEHFDFSEINHYTCMVDAFGQSIQTQSSVPTPLSDALKNQKVIDAIVASTVSKTWEDV